ncbi:MAG: cbb3-type cytochrome c oxidase subunit II [Limisphaerales bacterium]
MKSTPLIFLGVFVAMALSWWGVVAAPRLQLADATTVVPKATGAPYPPNRPGLAQQGAELFRSEGCYACHSQMVRPEGHGADIARGWGARRSVAQDYLRDNPALPGSIRVGPDLHNLGVRLHAGDTNLEPAMVRQQLLHLYHPHTVMPRSVMPAYPYLFETRPVRGEGSHDALTLPTPFAPPAGHEVVPRPEAHALVAYLLSLRHDVSLREAPVIPPPTNGMAAVTNAAAPAAN